MQAFIVRLLRSLTALKAVAPYAAIELLLPGGSLIALGLWAYQRFHRPAGTTRR